MSTATTQIETEKRSSERSRSKLVPELRFEDFDGGWMKKKLGGIGKVSMCKRIMKDQTSPSGDIPFYKIGTFGKQANAFIDNDLYEEFKSKYSYPKKGDVLIAASGATYGKTVVFDGNPGFFQDSNIVWIDNDETIVNNTFLNISYQIIKWAIQTSTIPRLYNDIIRNTLIFTPTLPEQQKIASFLSAVDEKIQQLTKRKALLEQYKKGVMQQLFSGQLRFKDENGNPYPDWEEKRLGDTIKEVVDKSISSNQYPILSSTKNDIYLQSEYFTRDIASADNTGYKILRMNQLVFSPQNLWLGNININTKFEMGIVSPSYKIFNFKKEVAIVIFFKDFLQTNRMMYEYAQASEQGASVVRRNLDMPSFKAIKIKLPCLEEQQKIATYLSSIDTKIESVTHQITQTQTFKKGLLQGMFV